eukprot:9382774-Karenia_brevis.AAC.1
MITFSRQSIVPGPQLLQDALIKKITIRDAKKQWRAYEGQEKQAMRFENWLLEQTLPFRCCTDKNDGEEVWKPISGFH